MKEKLICLCKAYKAIEQAQEQTNLIWEQNHLQTLKLDIDDMINDIITNTGDKYNDILKEYMY